MKPGVGITSSQPGPNTSASGVNGSFLPPPEGLRGSSVCSGPLRPHRQLSLQALGEREGKEERPSLLPAGPPARGGDLPAQVKPTDASWDPCWGIHADPASLGSCPRGGSCWSLLPLRTTTPSSCSSPLWPGRSAPWVSQGGGVWGAWRAR